MARAGLLLSVLIGLAAGLIFAIHPSLDLEIAGWFIGPGASGPLAQNDSVLNTIRIFNLVFVIAVIVWAGAVLSIRMFAPRFAMIGSARVACLVLFVYIAGPGLVANAILKENWSRPRPGHVVEFGGTQTFKPWWDPRGTCPRNCSFVSGEASAAFAILALSVVAPIGWRYRAVGAGLAYGVLVGGIRVMAGGHFTSDVIFAGVFTALVVWAVHGFIFRWSTRVDHVEAERRVGAFAETLRSVVLAPFGLLARKLTDIWAGRKPRAQIARRVQQENASA